MDVLLAGSAGRFREELGSLVAAMGEDWRIARAPDAASTLQRVAESPFDAVVVGSTPGLGIADLLGQVRTLRPDAVRAVLLDDAGVSSLRVINEAHRFLPGSLSIEGLLDALYGAIELRELLDDPRLRERVGRVERLPSPPRLYLALNRALDDERVGMPQVAQMVMGDAAVAAKVLQLCNSAYFSLGRSTTDLRAAVTRLGLRQLRDIVLASEVFSVPWPRHIDVEQQQSRALLASRLAAQLLPASSAELGATAALLADIGLLLPGVRDAGLQQAGDPDAPDHVSAGAYLLGLWGLPMPIVEAVAFHRTPARSGERSFWVTGAVHVATALTSDGNVDEDWLRSIGALDRLPQWRAQAEALTEQLSVA